MKIIRIFSLILLISSACSDDTKPSRSQDTSTDFRTDDHGEAPDLSADLGRDLGPNVPTFPDPNRESKAICETSLDCARGEHCSRQEDSPCYYSNGCGIFGEVPENEDWACIIEPVGGNSIFSGVECEDDSICPPEMPHCYLRACQVNPPCKLDTDCPVGQFCDWGAWCVIPKACETGEDCIGGGGGCGADKICARRM